MSNIDEKLTQFVEFTGCSTKVARDILEGCQWDVQKAIDFFFGADTPNIPSNPTPKSPSHQSPNLNNQKTITKSPNTIPPTIHPIPKPQPNKTYNLSPNIKHNESTDEPEKLILSGTHEKFNEFRLDAKEKNRWLLVLLTEKPLPISILKQVDLRDFTNTRFVPLEINREEVDGQWFTNAYNVKKYPYYAILDPTTTELVGHYEGKMTSTQRHLFLKEFLHNHPEKGLPIEYEMTDLYNYTLGSSDQSSSSTSESEEVSNGKDDENENTDPGPIVKVMIQLSNGKKTKLEIGENEKIKVLYKKVGSLIKKSIESFKLVVPYPITELNDMSKTILDMKLKNSMIRVEDVI